MNLAAPVLLFLPFETRGLPSITRPQICFVFSFQWRGAGWRAAWVILEYLTTHVCIYLFSCNAVLTRKLISPPTYKRCSHMMWITAQTRASKMSKQDARSYECYCTKSSIRSNHSAVINLNSKHFCMDFLPNRIALWFMIAAAFGSSRLPLCFSKTSESIRNTFT